MIEQPYIRTRTKTISNSDISSFDIDMNRYLDDLHRMRHTIVDIQYRGRSAGGSFSAMIIYQEKNDD